MFSIVETGGKQYRMLLGTNVKVEKLDGGEGDKVAFDKVLLVVNNDGGAHIGEPYVVKAKVSGEIVKQGRHDKVIYSRYKPKKRVRKKGGHRQPFTEVLIKNIEISE